MKKWLLAVPALALASCGPVEALWAKEEEKPKPTIQYQYVHEGDDRALVERFVKLFAECQKLQKEVEDKDIYLRFTEKGRNGWSSWSSSSARMVVVNAEGCEPNLEVDAGRTTTLIKKQEQADGTRNDR